MSTLRLHVDSPKAAFTNKPVRGSPVPEVLGKLAHRLAKIGFGDDEAHPLASWAAYEIRLPLSTTE